MVDQRAAWNTTIDKTDVAKTFNLNICSPLNQLNTNLNSSSI